MDTLTDTTASTTAKRAITATDVALIAAFAALIVVSARLPGFHLGGLAVPITLQTFAVLLSGAVLGAKRGFLAVLLYLGLGIVGLPVFTDGGSGLGRLAGVSGGYLIAFPLSAALCGFIVERLPRHKITHSVPLMWAAGFGSSLVFVHTIGPLGMHLRGDMSLGEAYAADWAFYPGDILKNLAMAFVATAVHRAFPDLLGRRSSTGR